MDEDFEDLIMMCAAYSFVEELEKKSRNMPSMRVNPYLVDRKIKGRFAKDFEDLKKHKQCFVKNFHIDKETFDNIFALLRPYIISKRNTRPFDGILPEEKFASVLEYLASGSLQRHIASIYRISKQHFGTIIDEVCDAINEAFKGTISEMNKESFIKWANDYNKYWQFPNYTGAIDGKHVALRAPPKAGSLFYNYKGFHSIVLMAVSDATYKFTYLDQGV